MLIDHPPIILCIDDQPIRYRTLQRSTFYPVVTTCRMEDFQEILLSPNEIHGICLDHDMPFQDGMWFATVLSAYNHRVVITSMNPQGAQTISNHFKEYETPHLILPCSTKGWETRALKFFNRKFKA